MVVDSIPMVVATTATRIGMPRGMTATSMMLGVCLSTVKLYISFELRRLMRRVEVGAFLATKFKSVFCASFENHILCLVMCSAAFLSQLTTLLLNVMVMGRSKGQDNGRRKLFYCKKIGDIEFASSLTWA